MEKLNNGCEYCRENEPKELFLGLSDEVTIDSTENTLDVIDYSWGTNPINIVYCPKCGRNLKTGNEMIELKSLKFTTWEEFEENLSSPELEKFRFAIQTDNKTDKIIMKCYDTMISWNVYDYSPEGYKLACEEIERIRKQFVLGICGG